MSISLLLLTSECRECCSYAVVTLIEKAPAFGFALQWKPLFIYIYRISTYTHMNVCACWHKELAKRS